MKSNNKFLVFFTIAITAIFSLAIYIKHLEVNQPCGYQFEGELLECKCFGKVLNTDRSHGVCLGYQVE